MGAAARSRARVEDRLAELQDEYDSFPVNQTTLSLPHDRFEAVRNRYSDGHVDAFVAVRNEADDVLHVEDDGDAGLPGTATGRQDSLEADARRAVRRETGIECEIAGIREVTIAGIRDADAEEGETVYRLVVVFDGEYREGVPEGHAEWEPSTPAAAPQYV